MAKQKKTAFFHKTSLQILGTVLILLIAILLLWRGNASSSQAISATPAGVTFQGEYRIGDGPWQEIVPGKHIPATKGDVTLRGNFHLWTPDGEYIGPFQSKAPIALYTNHINLTFREGQGEPYTVDTENPLFGVSACGVDWTAHTFTGDGSEPIEILVHNPHRYGNDTAIDTLLSRLAIWGSLDFETGVLKDSAPQRNTGIFFIIASLLLLGTALFSTLIHTKNSKLLWLLGLVILFAGIYFIYSMDGVSFWKSSQVFNTTLLGISMMLYMLFLSMAVVQLLDAAKKPAFLAVTALGAANALCFLLPAVTNIAFYDTWLYWVIFQMLVSLVLIGCLIREFTCAKKRKKWLLGGALLPLVGFGVDAVMTGLGHWEGGLVSRYVFVILFVAVLIVALRIIPQNINTAAKAKELEAEKNVLNAQLAESRITIMMSQIRPHFIYNTLGSIEQLCQIDPKKAGELVHNFAKYLRGNFGELDNPRPIQLSQEMEHVRYYVSIEQVRFPDMTFTFEMGANDFSLPALTVQPIVENAIKHGLMQLQTGGTIRVTSYETENAYCVSVEDDGAGFDTGILQEDRTHMGIRNIRERLKAMVGGTLEIESTIGVGTKVLITVPKEVEK